MRKVSYEVCRKFVLIIYYGTNEMIDKVVFRCFSFTISTVKWRAGSILMPVQSILKYLFIWVLIIGPLTPKGSFC